MLIPLRQLYKDYDLKITGVIHVGAHWAQEHKDYMIVGIPKVAYIEASKPTFDKLCRMHLQGSVTLHHTALADYEGSAEMHIETANQGQSSSLLKPGTHTAHYPGITFPDRETVNVTTLDRLGLTGYNFLNIDVQGAELLVLKGGPRTLEGVDYIYTEVNREAVYEGCPMIEELDAFLTNFDRVSTVWTGQGWGDAFYIRKSSPAIQPVPLQFRPEHPFPYPTTNRTEFERWFYLNTTGAEIAGRTYLPIFWTGYYVKFKYGKDKAALANLQQFLNKLDRSRKYFTIVQYDDGILNDISHLDIKVFSMSGGRIDYPLPLIAEPLPALAPAPKDIFCSFVGKITHPIRKHLIDQLSGKPGYYISVKPHSVAAYSDILNRSQFVLCPRGYGPTSFRISEALQFGAVPVYCSDKFILPHNMKCDPWMIVTDGSKNIERTIDNFWANNDDDIRVPPRMIYEKYFTYSANKKLILENI